MQWYFNAVVFHYGFGFHYLFLTLPVLFIFIEVSLIYNIVLVSAVQQSDTYMGFPGGSAVKSPSANAGDAGSIPGWGRSPGEGKWQTHSSN